MSNTQVHTISDFSGYILDSIKLTWTSKGIYGYEAMKTGEKNKDGSDKTVMRSVKKRLQADWDQKKIDDEMERRKITFKVNLKGLTGDQVRGYLESPSTTLRKHVENTYIIGTSEEDLEKMFGKTQEVMATELKKQTKKKKKVTVADVKEAIQEGRIDAKEGADLIVKYAMNEITDDELAAAIA